MIRGRKRKLNVKRVNGRISQRADDKQAQRSTDERDAMAVATEARERIFGVDHKHSGTELAGSTIGRMLLTREITRCQYDAAMALSRQYAAYARALDFPPLPRAVDLSGRRGGTHDVTGPEAARAVEQWDASKRILQEANNAYRTGAIYSSVWFMVINDQRFEHMIGDLRIALNALARHYQITEGVAA